MVCFMRGKKCVKFDVKCHKLNGPPQINYLNTALGCKIWELQMRAFL